jgi:methionyl-tRNA synthetase
MGKSLGNAADPYAIADRFGPDSVRYFLLREAPFGSDFSWSDEKVRQRHNDDLGNDLGNLLRRSLAMLDRYRAGKVPAPRPSLFGDRFTHLGERVGNHIAELGFRDALESIWELITALNRSIEERRPWELHRRGATDELDAVLYDLCEGLRWLAHLLAPFMPSKASEIHRQLGLADAPAGDWRRELRWGGIAAETQTRPGEPLFPRLEA